MNKIIIAIDGYAACGKSTLAKQLAEKLNYLFLDTGAMYRAVTYYFMKNKIDWKTEKLSRYLKQIHIQFLKKEKTGNFSTWLNGENIEEKIRSPLVSNYVSEVASLSIIRKFLVKQQQQIGKEKGIVMDGRDIGTVVFPHAELKIFVKARMEVRVQRRYEEFIQNGIKISINDIKKNLLKRDHQETTRQDSPLTKAEDAVELDNSDLTHKQQLKWAYNLALRAIAEKTTSA